MAISELNQLRQDKNLFISPDEVMRLTRLAVHQCGSLARFETAGEYKDLRELFTCALIALMSGNGRKDYQIWLRPGDNPPDVLWADFFKTQADGNYPILRIEVVDISYRKKEPIESIAQEIKTKLTNKKYAKSTWLVCRIDYQMTISIADIQTAIKDFVPDEIMQVWLVFTDVPKRPYRFHMVEVYPKRQTAILTEADITQPINQEPIRRVRIPMEGTTTVPRLP